ncbi:MAG: hypothetical protein N2645_08660 [Clostridia bacterium]|nr:hypothetical protein [Clostridia bacterium]
MKRIMSLIGLIILLITSNISCFKEEKEKHIVKEDTIIIPKENPAVNKQKQPSEAYPLIILKDSEVKWITKKGGLPSDKVWAVLYPEKDSDKIHKILNLIKSNSKMEKVEQKALKAYGYPVDIVIKMKDESDYTLRRSMELTTNKLANGTETKGRVYDDRIILTYVKNNVQNSYVVFSKDLAEYLNKTSNSDFPKN